MSLERERERAQAERDPELCGLCDDADPQAELVATPEGPLCEDHAAQLAQAMRAERGGRGHTPSVERDP